MVLGCGTVAQVVEGELVGGRLLDGDRGVQLEVTVDVKQFSRVQRAPSGVFVHAFAGHHHRGGAASPPERTRTRPASLA